MQKVYIVTHKQLELHWCIFSTVATDALELKHQAISLHTVDKIIHYIWMIFKQKHYIHSEHLQKK